MEYIFRGRSAENVRVLVDYEIHAALRRGALVVSPDDGIDTRIQPASLDVRLGSRFARIRADRVGIVDPKEDSTALWQIDEIGLDDFYVVHPGELILAATYESIALPDTMVARVEGKSSLGRLGLLIHATAGFVDPGWALAPITLEISVVGSFAVKLWPAMPIAQLAFQAITAPRAVYSGKYVGTQAPTPSRYHQNWTGSRWV